MDRGPRPAPGGGQAEHGWTWTSLDEAGGDVTETLAIKNTDETAMGRGDSTLEEGIEVSDLDQDESQSVELIKLDGLHLKKIDNTITQQGGSHDEGETVTTDNPTTEEKTTDVNFVKMNLNHDADIADNNPRNYEENFDISKTYTISFTEGGNNRTSFSCCECNKTFTHSNLLKIQKKKTGSRKA